MLSSLERQALLETLAAAKASRRPPQKIEQVKELNWAASILYQQKIVATAVFCPGDSIDAVQKVWESVANKNLSITECTLLLSVEPSSSYQRIPPTTETIRRLQFSSVIVGCLNPAPMSRGRGLECLQQLGIRVELADGEEALACQCFCEDYGKAISKSLPIVKLLWQLEKQEQGFHASVVRDDVPIFADISVMDLASYESLTQSRANYWVAVCVYPEDDVERSFPLRKNTIFFLQGEEDIKRVRFLKKIAPVYSVPTREGKFDHAKLVRKLCDLGFLSVLFAQNLALFPQLLQANLVDSLYSFFPQSFQANESLNFLQQQEVRSSVFSDYSFYLENLRLFQAESNYFLVESKANLQLKKI